MGNMLPACLAHQGTTTAGRMKPRQRLISLELLVKAVRKLKNKRLGKSDGKSPSSPSATVADEKGGGELEVMRRKVNSNPKGNVLRSRLHGGRSGGHKKGVVRVKVVLTKEEAARLLTLTVGGQKTAAQIVAEIKRMELRRAANAWRPALESIPEEAS